MDNVVRRKFQFPEIDAPDSEILSYKGRWFSYESTARSRWLEQVVVNLSYEAGDQWKELDRAALVEGVRGFALKTVRYGAPTLGVANLPRPVSNYITSATEVEISSLGKRELTPKVICLDRQPQYEAAAKVAEDVLNFRLKEMHWPEIREEAIFLFVVTGTAVIKTWWDETYIELAPIGAEGAMRCPSCGTTVASSTIPKEMAGQVVSNTAFMKDVPPEGPESPEELQLGGCPAGCENEQMEPYQVSPDEYTANDFFGRPLADFIPKGNTSMEVVSPFDIFVENAGYDVDPRKTRIWGQVSPRPMDWIEERYPAFVGDINPEDAATLMRQHPVLGHYEYWGRYSEMLDANVYADHARVFELHCEKTFRFPEGRSLVVIDDKIVENGPLYRSVDTNYGQLSVPRVKYHAARFKPKHRRFQGQGVVDNLVSPQNRLNGMDAQAIMIAERLGTPNLLFSEGMDVQGPEWDENYGAGMFLRYSPDPSAGPGAKPEVFPPYPPPTLMQEQIRNMAINDIKQISGPQDIEIGEAPKNISTTSGLQLLGEQAERRRAARERALIVMFEAAFEHTLRLIWTLRSDEDSYEVETAEGEWSVKQYTRNMVLGQTKVKVEKQAYVDKSLWQREGTREAQADGLYRLDSQYAIKKLLEYRGLPTDVNEDLNRQVDLAERQFIDYINEQKIPTTDENLDDPVIRFNVLGTQLLTDQGQRLLESYGWPQLRKQLAGWEQDLDMVLGQEQMVLSFYGGRLAQPQAQQMYAQSMEIYQQQKAAHEQAEDQMAQAAQAGMPAMPSPPPQQPPPPVFPPAAMEDKIMMVWMGRMGGQLPQIQPDPMEPPDAAAGRVQGFLQFMAVVMAYKIMAKQKMQAAAMGAVAPSAPGQGGPGQQPQPGQDFVNPANGNNPPTPPIPSPAPGVNGGRN